MPDTTRKRLVIAAVGLDTTAGRAEMSGITKAARAFGWTLESVDPAFLRSDFAPYRQLLAKADGVIARHDDALADGTLASLGVPLVALDVMFRRRHQWATILADDRAIAAAAATELLSTGRRLFAAVAPPRRVTWTKRREAAFVSCIRAAGCNAIRYAPTTEWDWMAERETLSKWLSSLPRPFGVFAANDRLAKFTLEACLAAGLKVPRDVAIVGADDDPAHCLSSDTHLSSVRIDFEGAGRLAAETLDSLFGRTRPEKGPVFRYGVLGVARRASSRTARPAKDRLLAVGREFIGRRYTDPLLSCSEVASAMGIGRRQAERLFAGNGMSIRDCVEKARLDHARDLLATTDLRVAVIAARCGFSSETYFSRLFRRRHGMPPGAWRRAHS